MSCNVEPKGVIIPQLNDINTLNHVIIEELKQNDILTKYKAPYTSIPLASETSNFKTFGIRLEQCALTSYTLSSGHAIPIPSFLVQAYCIIKSHANVEGIFRLSGNIQLQKQMISRIENGGIFEPNDNIHNVTNVVKHFFRDLPSLILGDKSMQETLIACLNTGIYASRCIRIALLMLPALELYTLVSFLELLKQLTKSQNQNKMDPYALAVVVCPDILPILEIEDANKIEMFIRIIQILIEDADKVGIVPQKTLTRYCLEKKKSR